jgi:hypothetical protein
MATESLSGSMEENTKGNGKMDSSTGSDGTRMRMV